MYKVTINLPNLPQGELVEVDGVGLFKNGESTDLPEDFDEQAFIAHHAPNNVMQDEATREATYSDEDTTFNLLNAFELTPGVTIEEFEEVEDYTELTVEDLKAEIKARNEEENREEHLPVTGTKDELVERLKEDDK